MIVTVIKAEIEAEAGWGVGTSDVDAVGLDRELLTDPHGHPWVPPSSLAGSLRAHLAGHDADERLMGRRPPHDGAQPAPNPAAQLTPSALWLLGTRARRKDTDRHDKDGANLDNVSKPDGSRSHEPPPPRTDVVASTAVDPVRRAALPKSLRHSRVVDEAAIIEFYVLLERKLTAAERELLAAWQPQIGRDRTHGGGLAQLRSIGYRTYDLVQPADLRAWLEAAGPYRFTALTPIPIKTVEPSLPPLPPTDFIINAALHIGTGSRRGRNAAIRTRGSRPLVPASTWKGMFRARVGYIIRSCWDKDAACVTQAGCGNCPLCSLFGSTHGRGRIAFRDSLISQPHLQERSHVAIDRISGGGQDKLLFTDDVVTAGRLTLRVSSLGPVVEWERSLLLHVVRDIHDGLIGIGRGAQRGQGTLRLADALHPALTVRPLPTESPVVEAVGD